MHHPRVRRVSGAAANLLVLALFAPTVVLAQEGAPPSPSPSPAPGGFAASLAKFTAEKPDVMKAARALIDQRYDLADRPSADAKSSRGRPLQEGVRVKLPAGMTWEKLGAMPADEIKKGDHYPAGFLPLPGANQAEGGMIFPQHHIDELKKQTGRDLTRFDIEHEFPAHLLPEFPPAIYLTTRPDLGDVSKGQLVTSDNFTELFRDILNPKQMEGLRLLVTPFPQAQFNGTDDRRSARPSLGVSCLDCHANGHTNAATHLVGDIRPQAFRHRIDTPSLRGTNVQRLFGSQRALKSVEDFTEFEQRAAYFDGDPVQATRKGVNILERGSQVHFMAEFQAILDFPPAPKLDIFGHLDPSKATDSEKKGEALFLGKARCVECHTPPYYTDNSMHNLQTERFFETKTIAGHTMIGDGSIKTFPLRGLRDSPPYLHDGRLLTIEDSVEFFNLILGVKLSADEKKDLVAFLRVL